MDSDAHDSQTRVTHTNCPFCKELVLIGAIRCKHCHADISKAAPEQALPNASSYSKSIACPECESSNVQKLKLISASGTSSSISLGAGISGGGLGVAGAKTTTKSELARSVEPKYENPSIVSEAFVYAIMIALPFAFILSFFIGSSYLGSFVAISIVISLFAFLPVLLVLSASPKSKSRQAMEERNAQKRELFENGFKCVSCGHEFLPKS